MGPIDYSLDVQTPFQAALQGYQAGSAIRQDQMQYQQQQAQLQAQQQQRKIIGDLVANKNATAADYANATLAVPGYKEQLDQAWKLRSADQQQSLINDTGQVYAALTSGKPQIAADILNKKADAMAAAGAPPQEVESNRVLAKLALDHPEFARAKAGMMLSALPGGDKVVQNFTALSLAPAKQREAEAQATTAEVAAGNAPTKTVLDNQKATQDILSAEAKRKVDELNVQIGQADSETKRGQLILERDKFIADQGKAQQAQGQGAQDTVDSLNSALQTVESIEKHPAISSFLGVGGTGSITGKLAGLLPGTDRKDLEGLVETLKSQQFLAGVKQLAGLGALSNAEGEKIGSAVASLNLDQSPGAFRNSLGTIKSNLRRGVEKALASGKLPTAGGAFVVDSPAYGKVREGDINRLLTQYPGTTREQVLQFLQSGSK